MPLVQGFSKNAVASNIVELVYADHPFRQAVAIARSVATKALNARGLGWTRMREDDFTFGIRLAGQRLTRDER
jgi:hypothetical protein